MFPDLTGRQKTPRNKARAPGGSGTKVCSGAASSRGGEYASLLAHYEDPGGSRLPGGVYARSMGPGPMYVAPLDVPGPCSDAQSMRGHQTSIIAVAFSGMFVAATGCDDGVTLIGSDAGSGFDSSTSDGGGPTDAGQADGGGVEVDAGIADAGVGSDAGVAEPQCTFPVLPAEPYEPDGTEDFIDPFGDDVFFERFSRHDPAADLLATWSHEEEGPAGIELVIDLRFASSQFGHGADSLLQVGFTQAGQPATDCTMGAFWDEQVDGIDEIPVQARVSVSTDFSHLWPPSGVRGCDGVGQTPNIDSCASFFVSTSDARFFRLRLPAVDGRGVSTLESKYAVYRYYASGTYVGGTIVAFGSESWDTSWSRETGEGGITSRGGRPPVDDFVSVCAVSCFAQDE